MTLPPDEPSHNHMTREIRSPGSGCPACEAYWLKQAARERPLEPVTVTVEIPASMAAHMDRHRVGGYSIQGGVLSSDSRPEVWPL
ncbi:hypothetical protein LAROYE_50 [Arthrobacter phage Laroye]|uniref:Uncharacterized protein n=1 Tax=Arthrobacter phage Laroye TaxID=1772305 RepID=A0A0U4IW21_9CAUD|nr:hypothetical protein FDH64_gp50 [Arthrobacter phage Laroye]ALY09575.1 hypothetical protein LAROYE_50 [Arthrobacter phage Laroye]